MMLFDLPTDEPELLTPGARRAIITPAKAAAHRRAQSAAHAVAEGLAPGECRHYASLAEWSTDDLLEALLELTGPSDLHFATWSMSETSIRRLCDWLDSGTLTSITAVLDFRLKIRRPEVLAMAKRSLTLVRTASCHAKAFTLTGGAFDVVVVGSANFTANPRIEAGVIHADSEAAAFHKAWISDTAAGGKPFDAH